MAVKKKIDRSEEERRGEERRKMKFYCLNRETTG